MTPEHELDSEDDEAPEEVTFQNARSRAEESARVRREVAKRDKALLKEKRKRKQELFSEQKKKKLLSDDILQTVSALADKQDEPSEPSVETEKGNEEKELSGKNKHSKTLRPRKSLKNNYEVVHLTDDSILDLQQQKAKRFLQNTLYGKNKNRTTANEFLSISRKKSSKKMPAFEFTNSSWGEEEKKKAAKFNLKWKNRKKL